jgi:hypothetical protein
MLQRVQESSREFKRVQESSRERVQEREFKRVQESSRERVQERERRERVQEREREYSRFGRSRDPNSREIGVVERASAAREKSERAGRTSDISD